MTILKNPMKRLFYVPKHSKVTDKSSFVQIFLCLLGMVFSISCLASLTWAWFSDTASSGEISITSAKYNVAVTVFDSSNNKIEANDNGAYTLKSGDYKITMTAEGTAKETTGYCKMILGGNEYYSPRLKVEKYDDPKDINSITFNVKLNEAADLSFSSSWEAYHEGELNFIKTDEVITYGTPTVINEDKQQGEDSAETENSPAVIDDDKEQDSKNPETENSQDNNGESNDDSEAAPSSVTDELKDDTSVEIDVP